MDSRLTSRWMPALLIGLLALPGAWAAEILTVRPKPPQAIEIGEGIPISISVGATAASGVKAGTVNMNLKGNGRSIAPKGLKLCPTSSSCKGDPLPLEANTTHTLWLHGVDNEGVYEGSVQIDHADSAAGNAALATTIYVSSPSAKAIGVALIAASVFFAFVFTVVLRHLSNRKSLLVAAAVAREGIHALQARFGGLTPPIRNAATATHDQLQALLDSLDEKVLERNGLPTSWSTPLTDANLAAYKAYVSSQALKVQNAKVVIEEGLFEIEALVRRPNGIKVPDLDRALTAVQEAAHYPNTFPPSEDMVRQGVQAAVTALVASDAARDLGARQWTPSGNGASGPRQLQLEVANLNRAMWVVVLLMTTGVGAAMLVLTGPGAAGFGTLEDYVKCVLWGLGLSAGSQLSSASTSTITAAFAVPKPL